MNGVKKSLGLHHQIVKQVVYGMLLFIIIFQFVMTSVLIIISQKSNNGNNINTYPIISIFYMLIVPMMFAFTTILNISINTHTFFRVSRKKYYVSTIIYLFILSAVLSIMNILISFLQGVVLKNIDISQLNNINYILGISPISELAGQFVFATLIIFLVGIMVNSISILLLTKKIKSAICFLILVIGIYSVMFSQNLIPYLKNGNLIVINLIFLCIIVLLIYAGYRIIKKIDIGI